jgi:hypothetical protein
LSTGEKTARFLFQYPTEMPVRCRKPSTPDPFTGWSVEGQREQFTQTCIRGNPPAKGQIHPHAAVVELGEHLPANAAGEITLPSRCAAGLAATMAMLKGFFALGNALTSAVRSAQQGGAVGGGFHIAAV